MNAVQESGLLRRYLHASSNYVALLGESLIDPCIVSTDTLSKCLWAIYTDICEEEPANKGIATVVTEIVRNYKASHITRGEALMRIAQIEKVRAA